MSQMANQGQGAGHPCLRRDDHAVRRKWLLQRARAKRRGSSINAWFRTNTIFDGVIDFDAAVRDPGDR
jgi:hypothetical protein